MRLARLALPAPPAHREREGLLVRPVPRALLAQLARLAPLVHREKEVLLAQPVRPARQDQQVLPVQLAPLVRPVLAARRIH